jgi:hypothetical protein
MKRLSPLFLALLCITASQGTSAGITPLVEANIDWSSFSVQLFDTDTADAVTPSLTWTQLYTRVSTNTGSDSLYEAWNWSDSLASSQGTAQAQADANLLQAAIDPWPSVFSTASAMRQASFTLSAHTIAVLTVEASIAMDLPTDKYGYATSYLNLIDSAGSNIQSSNSTIWLYPAGTFQRKSVTLTTPFANMTGVDMNVSLQSEAHASSGAVPVPEPLDYVLMVASLAVIFGWVRPGMRRDEGRIFA